MPAATAAAEPLLEPPATWSAFQGLTAAPKYEAAPVGPNANSCRFVLPIRTAPASRKRSVGAEFVSAVAPTRIFEAAVVGRPATWKRSLRETGTPSSGPRGVP